MQAEELPICTESGAGDDSDIEDEGGWEGGAADEEARSRDAQDLGAGDDDDGGGASAAATAGVVVEDDGSIVIAAADASGTAAKAGDDNNEHCNCAHMAEIGEGGAGDAAAAKGDSATVTLVEAIISGAAAPPLSDGVGVDTGFRLCPVGNDSTAAWRLPQALFFGRSGVTTTGAGARNGL
jgi:hypothetical protein